MEMNDIGRISIRTSKPIFYDEYKRNRKTGSIILIDPQTNETIGAGMII
jgi:sulfate adenylyltransferase subunit 1